MYFLQILHEKLLGVHFLIAFLNLSRPSIFCKCLGVYLKLLAKDSQDFQFRDILILLKAGKIKSFGLRL